MGKCNICPLKLLREDVIWLLKLAERERGAAIILLVGDNLFFFLPPLNLSFKMLPLKVKKELLLEILSAKKYQSQTECEFKIEVHQSFYTFTLPLPLCSPPVLFQI